MLEQEDIPGRDLKPSIRTLFEIFFETMQQFYFISGTNILFKTKKSFFSLERDGLVEFSTESNEWQPGGSEEKKIITYPNRVLFIGFSFPSFFSLFKPTFRRILPCFFRVSKGQFWIILNKSYIVRFYLLFLISRHICLKVEKFTIKRLR